MNTTSFFPAISITLICKDMSESMRLWIQSIVSRNNTRNIFIFAKVKSDNTLLFYTEEGLLFYELKFANRLPIEMYSEKLLVGVILDDSQCEESGIVKLLAKLVANPKEEDRETAELAKFRREMIKKFG